MRKWREIHYLHFLIFSLFPPSLSISYIKNCIILAQNGQYGTFVVNVTKKLSYVLWKIILGRLRCEKAPQVVRACFVSNIFPLNWFNLVLFFFQNWHFTHPIEFQMLWKWKQSTQRISNSWKEQVKGKWERGSFPIIFLRIFCFFGPTPWSRPASPARSTCSACCCPSAWRCRSH